MLHLGNTYPIVDHNRIGSDGCFYISKSNLPRLQTLDLSHNILNDSAAGHLANTNLPKLLHLNLSIPPLIQITTSWEFQDFTR